LTGGATIGAARCSSHGPTSGAALEITGTFPNAPAAPGDLNTAVEVLTNPNFTYTPLIQGAITSLSASVDKNLSVNIALI
jgi:hypothetical protein